MLYWFKAKDTWLYSAFALRVDPSMTRSAKAAVPYRLARIVDFDLPLLTAALFVVFVNILVGESKALLPMSFLKPTLLVSSFVLLSSRPLNILLHFFLNSSSYFVTAIACTVFTPSLLHSPAELAELSRLLFLLFFFVPFILPSYCDFLLLPSLLSSFWFPALPVSCLFRLGPWGLILWNR